MKIKAIIEMPAHTNYKYEANGKGGLILDRVLSIAVPSNYGYVPKTLCGDGDPLDIFVISGTPLLPLSKVKVKIIGAVLASDGGDEDPKLISVLDGHAHPPDNLDTSHIIEYLNEYKNGFKVLGLIGPIEAGDLYIEAKKSYEKNKKS